MREEIGQLEMLNRLKEVSRWGTVGDRHESAAEHTWSALVLARYFLPRIDPPLDEGAVITMLLYHDLVEIEAGDAFTLDPDEQRERRARESAAHRALRRQLPEPLATEFDEAWRAFERQETREARFCLAIDKLDPVIHSLGRRGDWKQWPIEEQSYRRSKVPYLEEFPPLLEMFEELFRHGRERGYFAGSGSATSGS